MHDDLKLQKEIGLKRFLKFLRNSEDMKSVI